MDLFDPELEFEAEVPAWAMLYILPPRVTFEGMTCP